MSWPARRRLASNVVFTDLSLNALLSFLVLFVLAYLRMNPVAKKDANIETYGEFAIVATWTNGKDDDVDLYVRDPNGKTAYFRSRDSGLMNLEYDDLGQVSDSASAASGKKVEVHFNSERVVIRGILPGEYVVNVGMYRKGEPNPTPILVTLYRIRGQDKELLHNELLLEAEGDEKTAFRFTLDSAGVLVGTSDLPMDMMKIIERRRPSGR